jgi:hypothetical protein
MKADIEGREEGRKEDAEGRQMRKEGRYTKGRCGGRRMGD